MPNLWNSEYFQVFEHQNISFPGSIPRPKVAHVQEVFSTLYHNLGINLDSQRLFDFRGRPQYLVDPGVRPIKELV